VKQFEERHEREGAREEGGWESERASEKERERASERAREIVREIETYSIFDPGNAETIVGNKGGGGGHLLCLQPLDLAQHNLVYHLSKGIHLSGQVLRPLQQPGSVQGLGFRLT
jgi:hypothetical protein